MPAGEIGSQPSEGWITLGDGEEKKAIRENGQQETEWAATECVACVFRGLCLVLVL